MKDDQTKLILYFIFSVLFVIATTNYLDDIDLSSIKIFEKEIIEKIKSEKPEIITDIQSTGKLEENNEKLLAQVIEAYKKGKK